MASGQKTELAFNRHVREDVMKNYLLQIALRKRTVPVKRRFCKAKSMPLVKTHAVC